MEGLVVLEGHMVEQAQVAVLAGMDSLPELEGPGRKVFVMLLNTQSNDLRNP